MDSESDPALKKLPAVKSPIKKTMHVVQIVLVVLGFAVAWGGSQLALPAIENLGFVILGLTVIIVGIEAVVTREIEFAWGTGSIFEEYRGIPAISYGIIFIEWGVIFIAFATLRLYGRENTAINFLKDRPGIIFIGVGVTVVCSGLMVIFGHKSGTRSTTATLFALIFRVVGLIPFFLGAALIAIGILEMTQPLAFDSLLSAFIHLLLP